MNTNIKKALLTTTLLVANLPVFAEYCDVGEQIRHLKYRIERGIDDGRLTPREVRLLEEERSEVRYLANELRDDRYISAADCDVLVDRIENLHNRITNLKHNDRIDQDYKYDYYGRRRW